MKHISPSAATIAGEKSPVLVEISAGSETFQERRFRQRRSRHLTMLVLSIVVLAASFALQINDQGSVAPGWNRSFSLPPLCTSRAWFGVECPGCGLTRSFVALAAGDLSASLKLHRLGWLLFVAVVLQLPYRAACLRRISRQRAAGEPIFEPAWPEWFGRFLIAALILNWLLKVVGM